MEKRRGEELPYPNEYTRSCLRTHLTD